MAYTIQSGFEKLRSNLEITTPQSSTVSTRQQQVRKAVERGFTVLTSFLAGSYPRSTMIGPLKDGDIDIIVVIDASYFKYKPSALLDRLRTILLQTYPRTPQISRNGQAVTITFTDFQVDVVPAFYREGGGYLIPDSITERWLPTDPTMHATELSIQNKAHNGDLIPLIKMVKGWNRFINGAFNGFYLELMTTKILTNIQISDFPSGVRYVFDKGREQVQYLISDPAGFGSNIGGLNGITVQDAVSRFATAYNRALKAERYAHTNIPAAFEEWRKIFRQLLPVIWVKHVHEQHCHHCAPRGSTSDRRRCSHLIKRAL